MLSIRSEQLSRLQAHEADPRTQSGELKPQGSIPGESPRSWGPGSPLVSWSPMKEGEREGGEEKGREEW